MMDGQMTGPGTSTREGTLVGSNAKSAEALLVEIYQAAVAVAHPETCVPPHLPAVPDGGRILIVGAGKAASAMVVAVERHYAGRGLGEIVGAGGDTLRCAICQLTKALDGKSTSSARTE